MAFIRNILNRRVVGGVVAAASAAAVFAGPLTSSASAATVTFIRTVDSPQAKLQLSVTSSQNNSPVSFVPRFAGVPACSSCNVPNTPAKQSWAQLKVTPSAQGVSLVNKQTNMCLDVAPSAQQAGASAVGTGLVLAKCDGTQSQQWKVSFATGNSSTFQNVLNKLMLTDAQSKPILEPITVNNNLPSAERAKHVQIFGSTLVGQQ
ncbi:RICIN domain-containing protein [Streptomyces sp. NPDC005500]|uniref:RICIN domain-containing protein n=1 Tax=Streptomyces sp. NPDC005500 TaxID=3155007 RepID=UPI0033B09F14